MKPMDSIDQDKLKEAYEYVSNIFGKLNGGPSLEGGKVKDVQHTQNQQKIYMFAFHVQTR